MQGLGYLYVFLSRASLSVPFRFPFCAHYGECQSVQSIMGPTPSLRRVIQERASVGSGLYFHSSL